jgi:hypothetical protein
MRKLAIVIPMFIFVAIAPRYAAACSCVVPPPPLEALEQADAVFTGQVTQATRGLGGAGVRVRIRLSRSFKGIAHSTETVHTSSSGALCGFRFEKGEKYIIYAYQIDGKLHTNICTRTRALADAALDLEALGDGVEVGRPRGGCGGPDLFGALQAVIFVLIALLLIRRP